MTEVWFKDGLRFHCQRCGKCCTGEPGVVWISPGEIQVLAAHLRISVAEFCKRYARQVFGGISLKEHASGDCVFLDHKAGCRVYEHRPTQCRTWPFWPSNVKTPADWEAMRRECPGAGRGALVSVEKIIELASLIDV